MPVWSQSFLLTWILQGDADIVLKKIEDHSVIEILRTAKKPFDKEKGSFYTKVELPDDFSALVYVELPEGFNTTIKYPVVVEVYGGPSSQVNTLHVEKGIFVCGLVCGCRIPVEK